MSSNANRQWGGRFAEGPSAIMEAINASIGFDRKMWRQDIRGSLAHAAMLKHVGIISADDEEAIALLDRMPEASAVVVDTSMQTDAYDPEELSQWMASDEGSDPASQETAEISPLDLSTSPIDLAEVRAAKDAEQRVAETDPGAETADAASSHEGHEGHEGHDGDAVAEAERRYAERYKPPRPNPERVVIEVAVDRVMGTVKPSGW